MSTTGEALLRAVFDDPDDVAAALVLADWLEESGGPDEQARAAFIRVQHRLAAMKHGDPGLKGARREEAALLKKYQAGWLAALPRDLHKRVAFEGGFARGVSLPAPKLVRHADALFAAQPITDVTITGVLSRQAAAALAAMGWWGRVRRLRLQNCIREGWPLCLLLGNPALIGVRELGAVRCGLGAGNMVALADWPGLLAVERLRLMNNYLTAQPLELLLRTRHLGRPREFILSGNAIDDEAARHMAGCERLGSLRSLWLYDNRVGPAGVCSLAASPHLAGLESLSLMRNPIGEEGALALLDAFPDLKELMVSGRGLTARTKERLMARFPFATIDSTATGPC